MRRAPEKPLAYPPSINADPDARIADETFFDRQNESMAACVEWEFVVGLYAILSYTKRMRVRVELIRVEYVCSGQRRDFNCVQ